MKLYAWWGPLNTCCLAKQHSTSGTRLSKVPFSVVGIPKLPDQSLFRPQYTLHSGWNFSRPEPWCVRSLLVPSSGVFVTLLRRARYSRCGVSLYLARAFCNTSLGQRNNHSTLRDVPRLSATVTYLFTSNISLTGCMKGGNQLNDYQRYVGSCFYVGIHCSRSHASEGTGRSSKY